MKNIKNFIFIILITVLFFGMKDHVYAEETCNSPNCCEYYVDQTGIFGMYGSTYVKITTTSPSYSSATATVTRMSDVDKKATIKNWSKENGSDMTGKDYYISNGKCPDKILISFKGMDKASYDIYFYNQDATKNKLIDNMSSSYTSMTVELKRELSSEEQEQQEQGEDAYFQNLANTLEETRNQFNELKCTELETYNEKASDYNLENAAECLRLKTALQGQVSSAKNEMNQSENTNTSGYNNLQNQVEQAEQEIEKATNNRETAHSDRDTLTGEALDGDIMGDQGDTNLTCEDVISDGLRDVINQILTYMSIAIVVLLIVLGTIDFTKAVAASDQDAIKKAQGTFVKRIIIAVIFFFLPILVNLVLGFINSTWSTCGFR